MELIGITRLNECVESVNILQLQFDEEFTEKRIESLRSLGTLEFHRDFARPFFQVRGELGFVVKGVEGEHTCIVTLLGDCREQAVEKLKASVSVTL